MIVLRGQPKKKMHEVFGVSNEVLHDSYVDRGSLDSEIARFLERPTHIALRGVSKCGKSWLRQSVLPEALTVQCRLGKTTIDIYRESLGKLDVRLEVSSTSQTNFVGKIEASAEAGIHLIAKVKGRASGERSSGGSITTEPVSEDINDLQMIADLIIASGRRLVIEDFHYLSLAERKKFAFDLKTLWDYGVFVVIVGVWSEQNMLLYLNPDLSGRVAEVAIVWTDTDLRAILEKGGPVLNLQFSEELSDRLVADSYENAGIFQALVQGTLDKLDIREECDSPVFIASLDALEDAELTYAEQLNPLYQGFAQRVASGIRTRANATGIYAHAMAAVLQSSDDELIRGLSLNKIYAEAHRREPRIQKGNLRTVLEKIEELQVDEDGRGLILSYNASQREVTIVDRQLLLYRRFSTVRWPWEDLISGAEADGERYDSA